MQIEMERFLAKIVNLMKDENLFASQGGPIILAQVASSYILHCLHSGGSSRISKTISCYRILIKTISKIISRPRI